MSDPRMESDTARNFGPMIGFGVGVLVGGVIALLLAPASGVKTRRRIGNAARRLTDDAQQTFEDARETVSGAASGLGADLKSAIAAGREAFRHEGETREPAPASRIDKILNPPATRTP